MLKLKKHIKTLKRDYQKEQIHELPAKERLLLGQIYLEERDADNTKEYREVIQAIKRLDAKIADENNAKQQAELDRMVTNVLSSIERELKEAWDSEDD
jgi:hypothetical protein